jgi:hypothetical protein
MDNRGARCSLGIEPGKLRQTYLSWSLHTVEIF